MTVIGRGFESRRLLPSLVARSDERSPSKREVAGSTPAGATKRTEAAGLPSEKQSQRHHSSARSRHAQRTEVIGLSTSPSRRPRTAPISQERTTPPSHTTLVRDGVCLLRQPSRDGAAPGRYPGDGGFESRGWLSVDRSEWVIHQTRPEPGRAPIPKRESTQSHTSSTTKFARNGAGRKHKQGKERS